MRIVRPLKRELELLLRHVVDLGICIGSDIYSIGNRLSLYLRHSFGLQVFELVDLKRVPKSVSNVCNLPPRLDTGAAEEVSSSRPSSTGNGTLSSVRAERDERVLFAGDVV